MRTVDVFLKSFEFYRARTLSLLDLIDKEAKGQAILGWRPGPGRAHIAWQLMHVAMTEEIFATERLAPHKPGKWMEIWGRFRGGSTPDDQIPTSAEIRSYLNESRVRLVETLQAFGDDRLGEVPEALKARKLTALDVLYILGWHEAHHHGQAHLTFNLFKATQ